METLRERNHTRLALRLALPVPVRESTVSTTSAPVSQYSTLSIIFILILYTVESSAGITGASLLAVVLMAVTGALMH